MCCVCVRSTKFSPTMKMILNVYAKVFPNDILVSYNLRTGEERMRRVIDGDGA